MNIAIRMWILPAAIVLCIGSFVFLNQKTLKANSDAMSRRFTSTSAHKLWNEGPFIDARTEGGTGGLAERIALETDAWEDRDGQLKLLRESISNLLDAYTYGDQGAFLRYRFPIQEGSWVPDYLNFLRGYIRKNFPEWKQDVGSMTFDELSKVYFHLTLMWKGQDSKGHVALDKDRYSVGFIKQINLDKSAIRIESRETPLPPLANYIRSSEHFGWFQDGPVFRFHLTPEEVIKQKRRVTYATVKLLLKTADEGPCPQFVRFFWADAHRRWLPVEYGIPVTAKRNLFAF